MLMIMDAHSMLACSQRLLKLQALCVQQAMQLLQEVTLCAGGLSTPNKGNLGASLLRRFNSGTPAEQPRRGIFRAGSGTVPNPQEHSKQGSNSQQ